MINISDEDRAFLLENIPDAERLLSTGKINDILSPLDDWIFMYGLESNEYEDYVLTDLGRKAQKIYDRIYYNN